MGLFTSKAKPQPDDVIDLPAPTVALLDDPSDVAWRRQEQQQALARHHVEFEPKPAELVAAVERSSAPKPTVDEPRPALLVWTREPPTQEGVYWWVAREPVFANQPWAPTLAVVLEYGGRLCVRRRRGDSSTFVNVSTLACMWAGPVATPANARLDDLQLGIV